MKEPRDEQRPSDAAMSADDVFEIGETYAAQSEALKAVWDKPELDVYSDPDGE